MLDPVERELWYEEYLRAALEFSAARGAPKQAMVWARAMSLIAEQFTDENDNELEGV